MPTTYTNGLKLPDLGSIDWYAAYKNNIDILDPIVGTVNGVATTYAPISHNHDASEITSGTIDIARLPPAALERLTTVADQTARYALTTSTVQLGDTVKQLDTGIMYLVVDTTKLNSADGYVEYSAGTASKAIADEDGTSIKTGYGKLAGNQTWTGNNTFSGLKSTGVIRVEKSSGDTEFEIVNGEVDATTNTLSRQDDIRFYDKNTKITGGLRLTYTTDTGTKIELYARSWKADGTASYNRSLTIYTNGQTGEYYTTLETNFLPKTTSAYSLGSSSYQWSAVYAQTYYYNGTAWGLDKENVWTSTNTFQQNVTYERTNFYHQSVNPTYILKDTGLEKGSLVSTAHTAYPGLWYDKNNANLGYMRFVEYDTGKQTAEFRISNLIKNGALDPTGSVVNCTFLLELQPSGAKSLIPEQNNDINLGTSTNKWKTLNGVNPGALSLPSDGSNGVEIDRTNWVYDGVTSNKYTPVVDGWLLIRCADAAGNFIFAASDGKVVSTSGTGLITSVVFGLNVLLPVRANKECDIRINCSGSKTVYLYPCLGNV